MTTFAATWTANAGPTSGGQMASLTSLAIVLRHAISSAVSSVWSVEDHSPKFFDVSVRSLNSDRYIQKKEIPVKLELCADDQFIASFKDANIAMSGDTATEALNLLKEHIADIFEILREEENLGPGPEKQLRILEDYIGDRQDKAA